LIIKSELRLNYQVYPYIVGAVSPQFEPGLFDRTYLYGSNNRFHIKPDQIIAKWILDEIHTGEN
jgi:hypothetical protein